MAKKTWAEIRSETVNLGFEKFKAYEKNKDTYAQAYNYAQGLIAGTTDPILEKVVLSKEDKRLDKTFDLLQICTEQGIDFAGVADVGILDGNGARLHNTGLVGGRFLTVPEGFCGDIVIYVRRMPRPVTPDSRDDVQVEISDKWANLMPYLMANRLYMDDNPSLAGYYYNLYDEAKNQLLAAENSPVVTVVTDVAEEVW